MSSKNQATICVLAILALTLAPAAAMATAKSGVVKPVVTILRPSLTGQIPGMAQDAHDDMHAGHGPGGGGGMGSGAPLIEDFNLPVKYSTPYAITTDGNGIIWFTEMTNHSVARLDPATGELKEYRLPSTVGLPDPEWDYDPKSKLTTPQSYDVYTVGNPGALTVDKNGLVWFVTLLGNSIVRFDPVKEEFTEYLLPTDNAQPYDISADSKGSVWFVEKNNGKIGYLDTEKEKIIEISLGSSANTMGIVVDNNDIPWIGEVTENYIGRFDPESRKIKFFPINVSNSQPGQMRFDNAGNLWVCMLHSQQLGVLLFEKEDKLRAGKGIYSVAPLPGYNAVPQALALDSEGRIWIVDSMTNQIGYFDSINLGWKLFEIPTANSQPMGVTVDKAGDIWFTQSDRHANKISRLKVSTIHEHAPAAQQTQTMENESASQKGAVSMSTVLLLTLAIILIAGAALFITRKAKP